MTSQHQSRIVSKILSPAIGLFLRSQVSKVRSLSLDIQGKDRQILAGYIPKVVVTAAGAIYQGLHLSQLHLVGENIRVNLGQMVRGQALRLLEPIPLSGEIQLTLADLQASLSSSLLNQGIQDLLQQLLAVHSLPVELPACQWQQVELQTDQFRLIGRSIPEGLPLEFQTQLTLANDHCLQLQQPTLQMAPHTPLELPNYTLDLGQEVKIRELTVHSQGLFFQGELQVQPTPEGELVEQGQQESHEVID